MSAGLPAADERPMPASCAVLAGPAAGLALVAGPWWCLPAAASLSHSLPMKGCVIKLD